MEFILRAAARSFAPVGPISLNWRRRNHTHTHTAKGCSRLSVCDNAQLGGKKETRDSGEGGRAGGGGGGHSLQAGKGGLRLEGGGQLLRSSVPDFDMVEAAEPHKEVVV